MSAVPRTQLRQRSDYTQKFNATAGRHGWLRLTPAYSVKMVEELIYRHDRPQRVLDPFCGTATTALIAAYHGHEGVTTEINPFLVWFAQAKMARYSSTVIAATRDATPRIIEAVKEDAVEPITAPTIHNIQRWWCEDALIFLCKLRAAIDYAAEEQSPERNLLLIAFCRTLIELSSAAFNHQSMSFKDAEQSNDLFRVDREQVFTNNVNFVLQGARNNPERTGQVFFGDARKLTEVVEGTFDLIITSPPYANRMSYIRELRPYMYWLGFLANGSDAGELDWQAIGGTWGIATSRLAEWEPTEKTFHHPMLDSALENISHRDNKNGKIMANYISRYFDDIWEHFRSLAPVLRSGAELHYIVGNSTFYGVLLSVEKVYSAMLQNLGFDNIECRAIRKRNSKKELFEFDVSARWPKNITA